MNKQGKTTWDIMLKDDKGKVVGRLTFRDRITFTGDVDKSAKAFFESLLKDYVNKYIEQVLKPKGAAK